MVKICGITRIADAELAIEAGATALGLNLWRESPRYIELEAARRIAEVVRGRAQVIAVVVDQDEAALRQVLATLRPDKLQLHGDEPDTLVQALQPFACKAVGLGSEADLQRVLQVAGEWVLLDARDATHKGGTGRRAPATLAPRACAARRCVLAGGLTADNVAEAVAAVQPWGVDVASGVESAPGAKDEKRLRAFVARARAALTRLGAAHV